MKYIFKNKAMKNYTQIHNEVIQNCKQNLDILGFATVLLSKPSDWVINVQSLMNELNLGKERVSKLLSSLEKQGYIYKQTNIQFAKKGEQKVFFYMFDCKEHLKETFPENNSESTSQLPLIATPCTHPPKQVYPDMDIPHMDSPDMGIPDVGAPDMGSPDVENQPHTNKDITNKDITNTISNKKNTRLTLRKFLKSVVDEKTAANILNANPNLTLEEFKNVYKRVLLEHKNNHCRDINAGLVMAVAGRWKFKSKLSDEKSDDDSNNEKIIKGNFNYYLSYFEEIGRTNGKELFQKFLKDCKKYDPNIVDIYSQKLKKELGI